MMADHFEEVRRRARAIRKAVKAPTRPAAPTDGAIAQRLGYRLGENPHHPSDPDHAEWADAWRDAQSLARER